MIQTKGTPALGVGTAAVSDILAHVIAPLVFQPENQSLQAPVP